MVYYYILIDVFDNENMKHRKCFAFVDAFNQVIRKKWLYTSMLCWKGKREIQV